MNPPSGGPITGPTSAGTVSQASACTSPALGTALSTMTRPTGTIIAPPTPCSARAPTSPARLVAEAQPIEATTKTPIAAWNTRRAPKRSAHHPLTGMKMASDTR